MKSNTPFFYTSLIYICAFILFMEWLYPVSQIGEVTNMTVFVLYTFYCFFISLLGVKWWLSIPLKGLGLLFIIDSLFMTPTILSMTWLTQFLGEVGFNLNALYSQQWYVLTPLFRSMLFLVLIWMLSYLLYYWFIVMKRVFVFALLTFIYLSLLDTFTPYEADAAIVRTFIVSFTALGLSNFSKEIGNEGISFPWVKKAPMWAIPLVSVVVFSTMIGYAAPKLDPQWPDPVPFIQSAAENAGGPGSGGGIQKVGYGENDSQLGGSFVQDYTPVFQAAAKEEHYWRVETKDIYTGKGWEKSSDPQFEPQYDGNITLRTFANGVETEELETMVDFQEDSQMEKIVYPYGIDAVEFDQTARVGLQLDPKFGEIRRQRNGNGMQLDQYTIHYNKPSFAINELREVNPDDDPRELKKHFTQLPDTLPERISELAEEITEDDDNRYNMARSIEQYFGRNGFSYQISNVPVPEEDQDYVDQFLFETNAGYCDNYSTSMVVMLRSLDIPARWAKGFTSGEVIQSGDASGDYDIYEVTNANAHSWVEVYFPEKGWVPFEPTQGFSNLTDFHMNTDEASAETAFESEEDDPAHGQQEEVPEEDEQAAAESQNDSNAGNLELNWWYGLTFALAAAFLGWLIYWTRFRWRTAFLSRKLQRRQDAKTFQEAYHWLLTLLRHKEFGKAPGQTLREYAKQVDVKYDTYAMNQLTNYYERMLYNNETSTQDINQVNQLWKNLIKEIMA